MTERERLIEILDNACFEACKRKNDVIKLCHYLADNLLENGVIVPPVKVGDTVYIHGKPVDIDFVHVDDEKCYYCVQLDCSKRNCDDCNFCSSIFTRGTHGYIEFTAEYIGKTVFLTPEDAEKALAERCESNE